MRLLRVSKIKKIFDIQNIQIFLDINDKLWDGHEEEEGTEKERVLRTNSQKVERAAAEWENDITRPPPWGKDIGREYDQVISRWKEKLRVKINLLGAAGKYYHCNWLLTDQRKRRSTGCWEEIAAKCLPQLCTGCSTLEWPNLLLHAHHCCFSYTCSFLRGKQDFALPPAGRQWAGSLLWQLAFCLSKQGDRHSQTNSVQKPF